MVEKYVTLYKKLSKYPAPFSAYCRRVKDHLDLQSLWEERDIHKKEKIAFQKSHFICSKDLEEIFSTTPCEINNEQRRTYSSNGRIAILRKLPTKQGPEKQYIEIWDNESKLKNIDVCAQEQHLQILNDEQFGCFQWSPCNRYLLYVAEKYFKAESFFVDACSTKDDNEKESKKSKGEEYLYRQSWGEQLQQVHHPKVYILDVESEKVSEVPGISEDISCGQAIWMPDSKSLVFVGWWHNPVRLGLIYCINRRSAIFLSDLESRKTSIIGASDKAVLFPRLSPNGEVLIYLQTAAGGPHFNIQSLIKYDRKSKDISTVVGPVSRPKRDEFPGLYVQKLPPRIWMDDNKHIILNSIWRCKQELLCINTETGVIKRLTNDKNIGCWQLLDCIYNNIVVCASSPSLRPHMKIGHFSGSATDDRLKWKRVNSLQTEETPNCWEIFDIIPDFPSINAMYCSLEYDAVLITPLSNGPFPLIVMPHGGPHSTLCASYTLSVDYFTQLGFAVLFVNYRGSLGFGCDSIYSLLGKIGSQDVNDVQYAVKTVLNTGKIDEQRLVLYGGSHGGFLVLSISGLFPDAYKACVARNPVVDLSGNLSITDIPDWCYVESGSTYNFTSIADPNLLKKMWEKSPLRLIDKIKTPVLFMLGSNDMRVPTHQGLLMHNALKARNVETRAYLYDDGHPLSKITSESDGLVHIAEWISKYVK